MRFLRHLFISSIIIGFVSLFIQYALPQVPALQKINSGVDVYVLVISFAEAIASIVAAKYRLIYLKKHLSNYVFLLLYALLFIISRITSLIQIDHEVIPLILILRNLFLSLRLFTRFKKVSKYLEQVVSHPSQSIIISFLAVIMLGTLLLMMPFTSAEGQGLSFTDSLFTATSAVCVTGLIVVDTAVYFSIWGRIVILALIQIGGLGIMILSFAALAFMGKRVSFKDKLLLSYMLSEEDVAKLSDTLKRIVLSTFLIEAAGAMILFLQLRRTSETIADAVFHSVFHAVSAFCNAGFALYSDSLESFSSNWLVLMTVGALIVAGGIGFSTLYGAKVLFSRRSLRKTGAFTLNTRIVLGYTAVLILSGAVLIYQFEHAQSLYNMDLPTQYLSVLFQSITLRTAGFNSISFSALAPTTLGIMLVFMFIGGASGGTAGGIKINSLAIIFTYMKSMVRGEEHVILKDHEIPMPQILKSFAILFIGLCAVLISTVILSVSENAAFLHLLFEAVSAFATVGLSTGVTPTLSFTGKYVIIFLMFLGRLGPLTFIAASATRKTVTGITVTYPSANLQIG